MKRIAVVVLMLLLALSTCAAAESINLEDYDFESLLRLKQLVDQEYYSRKESEPLILSPGVYTVGTDIKAGRYYIAAVSPAEYTFRTLRIYDDYERLEAKDLSSYYYVSLGELPESIILFENNCIRITEGEIQFKTTVYNENELYQYDIPEGTYVPVGAYYVGEDLDIPPGTYTVYPASLEKGEIRLYKDQDTFKEDGTWHLKCDLFVDISVTSKGNSTSITLEEGYVIYVESPVIMKRPTKLKFD